MQSSEALLFNEWITLTALHEEALAALGAELLRQYAAGTADYDPGTLELCREVGTQMARAREHRDELQAELAGDGPTPGGKAGNAVKKGLVSWYVQRNLESYRATIQDLKIQLGQRAVHASDTGPLLEGAQHLQRCRAAERLAREAERKWQQIVARNGQSSGGAPLMVQLLVQAYHLAGKLRVRPLLLKLLRLDLETEKVRLKRAFLQRERVELEPQCSRATP
ncbi:MAG: hypothetical protein AB1758_31645 [Candidatus Eremiobacterota bacterium]